MPCRGLSGRHQEESLSVYIPKGRPPHREGLKGLSLTRQRRTSRTRDQLRPIKRNPGITNPQDMRQAGAIS